MVAVSETLLALEDHPSTGNTTHLGIVIPAFSQAWMRAEPARNPCEQ